MEPSDEELVRYARSGDAQAFGVLLARHRAAMHAVAVARLGPGPDVEDVVQDANLVAIASLDRLHEPERARSWLTGITRNLCREHARRRSDHPVDRIEVEDPSAGPEERLADVGMRDWIWDAVDILSEPLRDAVVLRYFSSASSYETIATVLGVPVGTVRSRLSAARRVLGEEIKRLADSAHSDHERLELDRASLFAGITAEYNRGADLDLLRTALSPAARLSVAGSSDVLVGRDSIVRGLGEDIEAGVHLRLLNVVAAPTMTVIEGAFENPLSDPEHCPPLTTQVMSHRGDEIAAIHLHYA
jgi:RNA polymerase sigma-70 factor (ECF subfamily)